MVWRWGLVVNESMVTRWFRRVEGISMNLEMVRLPGEDLFYREELERWGVVVQSLRQSRLRHFFVFFKPLRYPWRGRHGVLERRLVQPGHSVRHLRITQVQQRGPGSSLSLGRVDLVRSLGRSDSLPEDFTLCCRDLLAVTLSILVLRKGSLGIHVQRCIGVEWRLIRAAQSGGLGGLVRRRQILTGRKNGFKIRPNRLPRQQGWSTSETKHI